MNKIIMVTRASQEFGELRFTGRSRLTVCSDQGEWRGKRENFEREILELWREKFSGFLELMAVGVQCFCSGTLW